MNSYLQGLITGAVLGSSLFFFIGSSPASYYDIDDVMKKVEEEWQELQQAISEQDIVHIEHELGDILMSLASLGRHLQTPPESALRKANNRFKTRFMLMENIAKHSNLALDQLTDQELDDLWNQAKQQTTSLQNGEKTGIITK